MAVAAERDPGREPGAAESGPVPRAPPAASSRAVVAGLPLTATTRLFIVRHGETVWNAEGRMQGQLDVSLNEAGHLQAQQLAEKFKKLGIAEELDAIVSSDLVRASQTAQAIAAVSPKAHRSEDAGLREIHLGDLQGLLAADIQATKAEVQEAWRHADFDRAYPAGESGTALMERGLRALRAAAGLGSCVVVVAHGGLIRWCAMCIELSGGSAEAAAATPEAMEAPRVRRMLEAPIRNCCCSTVLYDHAAGLFRAERWFEQLGGERQARDDTG